MDIISTPTLDGEDLARAAAADFEEFFLDFGRPEITISVESVRGGIASIKRRGDKTRIAISPEFAREPIDSADRLHFHLLIIGHEIAHLVHRHLYAGELENADDRALEFWADFYGAKVMMTLVTFGARVSKIYRGFFPKDPFKPALMSVGQAVDRLLTSVYREDKRYPKPLLRAGLVCNGITSFLRHDFAGVDINPQWYISVFMSVLYSGTETRRLMNAYPEHAEPDVDPIERARAWHRTMQGNRPAIMPWFRPEVVVYLHTNFDQTDDERAYSQSIRLKELQAAGFLLDEPDPIAGAEDNPRRAILEPHILRSLLTGQQPQKKEPPTGDVRGA